MKKIKFFYDDGRVTFRKSNKKESKLLEVYKYIIGVDTNIVYRQDSLKEWSCQVEDEQFYFIKSDYNLVDSLCSTSGFSKQGALDYMISIFKKDLKKYYNKFAVHYNYFK